jgi:hypothetical protein
MLADKRQEEKEINFTNNSVNEIVQQKYMVFK